MKKDCNEFNQLCHEIRHATTKWPNVRKRLNETYGCCRYMEEVDKIFYEIEESLKKFYNNFYNNIE